MPTDTLFPMRDLVQHTGVNASTLRAWENRNGLIKPLRTPAGHRLYSLQDVARVRRLQELLAQGLSLSDIGLLLDETSVESIDPEAKSSDTEQRTFWQIHIDETLRAIEDFSSERLDQQYSEACALYPIDMVSSQLVEPILERLGERWSKRPSGIAEEHFYSAWLRNKLGARLHHYAGPARHGGALVLACLPDESHEIGLLLFALAALQQGYRIIYLGANMPIRQIAPICTRCRPQAIILVGREMKDPPSTFEDIAWLVEHSTVPVMLGSHDSVRYKAEFEALGAVALGDHIALGLRLLNTKLKHRDK